MNLWTHWLEGLRSFLDTLSIETGLGLGLAIIATTVLIRLLLLPISWSIAYRGCVRQKKMLKLQPELQSLKEQYAQQPHIYLEKMTELYRRHGLSMMDGRSLMGALLQMPVLLGMFQALRQVGEGAKFLWVANLVKPDTLFALLAGAATALMVMVNPDIPEQMRLWLIIVPSVIAFVVALKFCSALSLYWIATNVFSALQTFAVHRVVAHRLRAGTLKI